MAETKKAVTPKKREDKESNTRISPQEKYHYAIGRRKSSVAQVRLYPEPKSSDVSFMVNGKEAKNYFSVANIFSELMKPLELTGLMEKVAVTVVVRGGGVRGQAEAVRLGLARTLTLYDESLRHVLKSAKYLKRDPRSVERKKPGLKKARRSPQWAKR